MNSLDLSVVWLQMLALLALEAGLVALAVAALRRWCQGAAWGRLFSQAGIAAVLLITAGELSGTARGVVGWAASAIGRQGQPRASKLAESSALLVSAPVSTVPSTGPNQQPVGQSESSYWAGDFLAELPRGDA